MNLDPSVFANGRSFETARRVVSCLKRAGFEAFAVGGAVRDALLRRSPQDWDIATSAPPEVVEALFPGTKRIGASFGVVMVFEEGFAFEVATFRTEGEYRDGRRPMNLNYTHDVKLDAARRDFTVNAFYWDMETGEILDFFNGLADLRAGILRTVGDPVRRFGEDYLRMLRAVRFAVRYGFKLDELLRRAIVPLAGNVKSLSAERLREELSGILLSGNPARGISLLDELGLLEVLLPEVSALKGVEQPKRYHPEGDVFVHTLKVLASLDAPDLATVWGALLHDVGKPRTFSSDELGVPHFYNHDVVGAQIADRVFERFKFDLETREKGVSLVRSHMRFVSASSMRRAKLRRLLADKDFPQWMALLRADCMGSHGDFSPWLSLLDAYGRFASEPILPEPFLNGKDILSFGIRPGPLTGKLLRHFFNRQLEGKMMSREEALEKMRRFCTKLNQ